MKAILRTLLSVGVLVFGLLIVAPVQAEDIVWDRNNDDGDTGGAITSNYDLWKCSTLNCTVLKTGANYVTAIPQTAIGVQPMYTTDLTGQSGALAVSARRASGEESPLSVQANFTAAVPSGPAPAIPAGLVIRQ